MHSTKSAIQNPVFSSSVLVIITIVTSYALLSDKALEWFFNTDTLYLPSIYKDLFKDGWSLSGWHLNHAPAFFPDMPLYFLTTTLGLGNLIVGIVLFSVCQYLIIISCLYFIIKHYKISDRAVIVFNFLLTIALFHFTIHKYYSWYYISFLLLSNAYHLGAFVNALLAFVLLIQYLKKENSLYLIGLVLLIPVAVISDKLFAINFTAVVLFSGLVIHGIRKSLDLKKVVWGLLILAFTIVGWKLSEELSEWGVYHIISADNKVFYLDGIAESWSQFTSAFIELIYPINRYTFLILIALTSLILAIVNWIKYYSDKDFGTVFQFHTLLIVFVLGTLITPVLSGAFTGFDAFRYNIPAIIVLWLYPGYILRKLPIKNRVIRSISYGTTLVGVVILFINLKQFRKTMNFYPEIAQQVDSLANEAGVKYGVAEYWDAKRITLFSRTGLRVYTAYDVMTPWYHVMNQNWFYQQKEDHSKPVDFEFIVYTSPVFKTRCDELFGNNYDSIGDETKLLLTPNFRFNPDSYQAYRTD